MVHTPLKKSNITFVKKPSYIIGALGRLVPEKGFNYLIEAIHILKDRKYNVKLIIGGSGRLEDRLKKLAVDINIGKNVEFIGWIKEKQTFFEGLDIFCIPSVFETCSIVSLEAMSQQVAIVCTKTLGSSQIFESGVNALVTKTASSQELADQIAYLIDNPNKRKELINNAYNKIINEYDSHVVSNKLVKALKNILV